MPSFTYRAKRTSGEVVTGTIDGDSREMVVRKLRSMRLFPMAVEESGGKGLQAEVSLQTFQRVTFADIVNFTRQLSDLTKAGLPLVHALEVLLEQTSNEKLRAVVRDLVSDVSGGTSLSDSLRKYPRYFPELYSSMVRAGEVGGYLDTVLDRLASFLENEADVRSRVRNAMAYPVIMMCVAVAVVLILTIYVVPTFVLMFEEQNIQLPRPTQFLIASSDFVRSYWYLIIAAISAGIYGFRQFVSTPDGKAMVDRLKLEIPLLGDMIRKQEISKFARTLGTLLGNGVSILKALDVVTAVITNQVLAEEVAGLKEDITEGERLSTKMKRSKVFPPVVTNMVAVGEETGELERTLMRVAESYESETDRALKTLVTMMEPLLIVFMAVVVGFIVMSMILPIFQLSTSVRG